MSDQLMLELLQRFIKITRIDPQKQLKRKLIKILTQKFSKVKFIESNLQISVSRSPNFDQSYQGFAQYHLQKKSPILSIFKEFQLHLAQQKVRKWGRFPRK